MVPQYDIALRDITGGIGNWRMWHRLGWGEVRRRYRRTAVGPFWTTLSLGVFILALGMVWSGLWGMNVHEFMPYLTAGMITWYLMSAIITEGCTAFIQAEPLIKQMRVSYALIASAMVWRNIIVFVHNAVVFVLVAIWGGIPVNQYTFLAIPGIAMIALNGVWLGLLFGTICTRFRDLQQLITSLLQIAMFATPVFWRPEQLQTRVAPFFVDLNPLYRFIDIVRAPLLGQAPSLDSWLYVLGATATGWILTLFLFARFRRRIPYWI
jgi:ABC-type polysaccharide/polyol phosphate export permease